MPKTKSFNKEKVLEAAANIFQQKGYNGTSIDDVLTATGLSRSSLYDSFQDKHSLYLQSLEFYKSAGDAAYEKINEKPLNGLQKLEVTFKEVVNHLIANPNDNGCLLVNAAAEMSKQCYKTNQVVCNNKEEVQELLSAWLNDAVEKKVLTLSKPARSYAQFLYNTLCGLRVMSQSGAGKNELNNIVKITLDSLN
ncbi:MAG: TetR/AcrR family transcriptional regulator [Sphingobacteriaceae bacterium]|nr:TetR/AcrR family transcriptional regulator [Sphingobacteriaceae bacterium]